MSALPTSIFTIASDAPFLDVLAEAIAAGFPFDDRAPKQFFPLTDWTILLPTRRAVRALQGKLLAGSGRDGLLMPALRPIGDIDEDMIGLDEGAAELPDAISATGRHFALLSLIDRWLLENPQLKLAREMAQSPQQAHALALSLAELVDSLEREDVSLERLPEAYDFDLAIHREAILSLLDLIRRELPAWLIEKNLVGPATRRNLMLRAEAQRLAQSPPAGPFIIAGSTGTLGATRSLLKAVAGLERGSIILPGLDLGMDEPSWAAVGPQHPQYAMKMLLASLEVTREAVTALGPKPRARSWLLSEVMRPSETSDQWQRVLAGQQAEVAAALEDFTVLTAADKNQEALSIALRLRQELEKPEGQIALVTPDRDLARRVKAALQRWDIQVDDSAGEPLLRFGAAAYLDLVLAVILERGSAAALLALLHHPLARFGMARSALLSLTQKLDLTLFRATPLEQGLAGLLPTLQHLRQQLENRELSLPAALKLEEADWAEMQLLCSRLVAQLAPLMQAQDLPLQGFLDLLLEVAQASSDESFWQGSEADSLLALLADIRSHGEWLASCDFTRMALFLRHLLQQTPYRDQTHITPRIAILGLLEARLVCPETVILGGLNEASWPEQTDPGPWLNRPMRDLFGIGQPERRIGQTAHDFVQAAASPRTYLTWSKRVGLDPALASRWLLRLETVLAAAGVKQATGAAPVISWAKAIDQPAQIKPCAKPLPKPALALRPARLSVTQIETLIRDPYAIYARKVLGLEALPEISGKASPALRGILVHASLGAFFSAYPEQLPENAVAELMKMAWRYFAPYEKNPEVMGFWWPRFQRLGAWLLDQERILRLSPMTRIAAEVAGQFVLKIGEHDFTLTARADRIDLNPDGQAHIIDYKTGQVPSKRQVETSFAPQLPLEAAMLAHGAFAGLKAHVTQSLSYIKISGGSPPGEIIPLQLEVMALAEQQLSGLIALLAKYNSVAQAYIPRFAIHSEDEVGAYDHLSRYREWMLADEALP